MCGFFYRATKDLSGQPNSRLGLPGFSNRDDLDFFLILSTAVGVAILCSKRWILVNLYVTMVAFIEI